MDENISANKKKINVDTLKFSERYFSSDFTYSFISLLVLSCIANYLIGLEEQNKIFLYIGGFLIFCVAIMCCGYEAAITNNFIRKIRKVFPPITLYSEIFILGLKYAGGRLLLLSPFILLFLLKNLMVAMLSFLLVLPYLYFIFIPASLCFQTSLKFSDFFNFSLLNHFRGKRRLRCLIYMFGYPFANNVISIMFSIVLFLIFGKNSSLDVKQLTTILSNLVFILLIAPSINDIAIRGTKVKNL